MLSIEPKVAAPGVGSPLRGYKGPRKGLCRGIYGLRINLLGLGKVIVSADKAWHKARDPEFPHLLPTCSLCCLGFVNGLTGV